jgi:hypothetical protein
MILANLMLHHREPSQALAVAYLAEPDAFPGLPSRKGQPVVKLLRIPTFEAYSAWALFEFEGAFHVRRIEWEHGMKLANVPGLYGSEAELDPATATSLLSDLAALSVPPVQKPGAYGFDGVGYAIIAGDHWCCAEFCWWEKPPEKWSDLAGWYDRALAAFDAVLPVNTLGNQEFEYRRP